MLKRSDDWRSTLIVTGKGDPKAVLANAATALRMAPEWHGVLAHDEFAMQTMALRPPPWHLSNGSWKARPWTPLDDARATEWLQHEGILVSADVTAQAAETVAHDCRFHPVRDYLDGLRWDGKQRLATWLVTHLGVRKTLASDATRYQSDVGTMTLVGAVARIRRPGCKVDTLPILEGAQGAGKSSALAALGGEWFTDEIAELGSKDAAMQTRSAWIIEIAELDAMSRVEVSKVKAFISRTTDRFRPPYGRRVIESPRQCIFAATTNSDAYLKDETGGRRFWPIRVGKIDIDAIRRDRDQIWAEAAHLYSQGRAWWFQDQAQVNYAAAQQEERYVGDVWDERISAYVTGRHETSVAEILERVFSLEAAKWGQAEQNRVARSLRSLGFDRYQARIGDRREWRYRVTG